MSGDDFCGEIFLFSARGFDFLSDAILGRGGFGGFNFIFPCLFVGRELFVLCGFRIRGEARFVFLYLCWGLLKNLFYIFVRCVQ